MIITYIENGKVVTQETKFVSEKNNENAERFNELLKPLTKEAMRILEEGVEKKYTSYYKKKSKGGYRRIDIPNEELKAFMRKVNNTFVDKFNFIFPNFMYGYVKNRGIKQLASLHKDNDVIIKMDIENFFNSCTLEFIQFSMTQVYPFCLLDEELLKPILMACTLHGNLPQGAPTSPILSNVAIIPSTYKMDYKINVYSNGKSISCFSIYADDIIVSFGFKNKKVTNYKAKIEKTLEIVEDSIYCETPLYINDEKTKIIRMWKSNGVWVTGLMITKDNRVTIGHKEKQKMKAMIYSFLADYRDGKVWSIKETQCLIGRIGFYKYIEPNYVSMIIKKYEQKTGQDYICSIENILNS